ncbi:hypothetical protein K439DRAFT_883222 [Ramaria rubella]|nr:hypothetical protein K439DRAFT_883222 [Ramaria rubella]
MRIIAITSLLFATSQVAVSAPIYSLARRAPDGGGGAAIPAWNVVQRDENDEDLFAREVAHFYPRESFSDTHDGLLRRTLDRRVGPKKPGAAEPEVSKKTVVAGKGTTRVIPLTTHRDASGGPHPAPNSDPPPSQKVMEPTGIKRGGNTASLQDIEDLRVANEEREKELETERLEKLGSGEPKDTETSAEPEKAPTSPAGSEEAHTGHGEAHTVHEGIGKV